MGLNILNTYSLRRVTTDPTMQGAREPMRAENCGIIFFSEKSQRNFPADVRCDE